MGMGQLVEVALEIDVALKEQAEKVFAENGLTLDPSLFTAGRLPESRTADTKSVKLSYFAS